MTRVKGLLRRPAAAGDAPGHSNADGRPDLGGPYRAWLDQIWQGDTRELREGRFLHQQADLQQAFETSTFWREVGRCLYDWGDAYTKEKEAMLFQGAPSLPRLASKPWESFLSRTWRQNVKHNDNWPDPPPEGWWLPDNWFEHAWDVVRTRFVVRYVDGVQTLADNLVNCASERRFGLEAKVDKEAKEDGYYAYHVYIRQPFLVAALDYEGKQERSSAIEIQVMTELAEVISALTHSYYEVRREAAPQEETQEWDISSLEVQAREIARQSFTVEKEIQRLRMQIQSQTPLENGSKRRGRRPLKPSRVR